MPALPLLRELLTLRPPAMRSDALRQAGFDILRAAAIVAEIDSGNPIDLRREEAELLLATILQQISLDDATFAAIASEIGIELTSNSASDVVITVPFVRATGNHER